MNNLEPEYRPGGREIYQNGIETGHATFETAWPDWEYWNKSHFQNCRLVVIENDKMVGWAALSPVSSRRVYHGVAEGSIYIGDAERDKGIGTALLKKLADSSEENGFWTLQASIFPENKASLKIHENAEFRGVGVRKMIGEMGGVWSDTVIPERLSSLI